MNITGCGSVYLFNFFGNFVLYSQSGNDQQEDLAKFGYKLNMKLKFQNIILYLWLTLLEPCIEIIFGYLLFQHFNHFPPFQNYCYTIDINYCLLQSPLISFHSITHGCQQKLEQLYNVVVP
jgi:hypothetical protein